MLAELQSMEREFNAAEANDFGAKLPDGIYQMSLKEVAKGKSNNEKTKDVFQLRLVFVVRAGPLATRTNTEFITFSDERAYERLKGRVKALGYPYSTLAECEKSLRQAIIDQRIYEFELKVGKTGYQNFNFQRIVDSAADTEAAEQLAQEGVDAEGAEEAETTTQRTPAHNAKNAPTARGRVAQAQAADDEDVSSVVDGLPD
jgi:hypothetical protein